MSAKKFFALFSIALFAVFMFFSYLVSKEVFTQFDFNTTVKMQDHISRRWDLPFSIFSILGSAEVTGFFWIILLFISLVKRYWLTLFCLFLLPIAMAIELFGKLFVLHPAPPYLFSRGAINLNFPSHYVQTDYSYPSGHMTRTAFLASFLFVFLYLKVSPSKRLFFQLGLVIFIILMIVSRIYLGEHWTTDVIGGTLLGTSFGIFSASTIPLKKKLNDLLTG